jgi:hypothetical protein
LPAAVLQTPPVGHDSRCLDSAGGLKELCLSAITARPGRNQGHTIAPPGKASAIRKVDRTAEKTARIISHWPLSIVAALGAQD